MSRVARIVRASVVGYGYQMTVALVGFWLTPVLLRQLGITDYGRWLVVAQVLALLGLLDLGVNAILAREVAVASGTSGGNRSVAEVVERARRLVWRQTPFVALIAVGAWGVVRTLHDDLDVPLGIVLATFAVVFPLKMWTAVLNGLQDLTFTLGAQATAWAVATGLSVTLVFSGLGLVALALGWATGELVGATVSWLRLRLKFSEMRTAQVEQTPVRPLVVAGLWVSLRQIAVLLANGTDLLILGWVLGPEAVVIYSCTAKLITFVATLPQLLVSNSLPALVELRGGDDPARMWPACRAVGTGMMLMSGGFALVVLAVNEAFVGLWVSPAVYGGAELTTLVVLAVVVRHWIFGLISTQFVWGKDRFLSMTAIADGMLTFVSAIGLTWAFGLIGIPLGRLLGGILVSGLFGLLQVACDAQDTPARVLLWSWPWAARFLITAGPITAAIYLLPVSDPFIALGLAAGGLIAYGVFTRSLITRGPLRDYWLRTVGAARSRFGPRSVG